MKTRLATALLLACVLACSDDKQRTTGDSDAQADAPQPADAGSDARTCAASDAPPCRSDAGPTGPDAATPCADCAPWPPSEGVSTSPAGLRIEAPASVPPGATFPIAVRSDDAYWGEVELTVAGVTHQLRMYQGAGSLKLTAAAEDGELIISAGSGEGKATRMLSVLARSERAITGDLKDAELAWDDTSDVVLSAVTRVPSGKTLSVSAGTRVRLAENARLEVLGTLRVEGSAEKPVILLSHGSAAWGELDFQAGSHGELSHLFVTGGGGDASRAFGHSKSAPMIRAAQADLTISHAVIADAPGKAFGTSAARVTLGDTLIARVDTGGEFSKTLLSMTDTHTFEIPDSDGMVSDDDNDGIYIVSAYLDAQGKEQASVLRNVVFAAGEDDGIDHNDAVVRVEGAVIRGVYHEGIATSGGHRIDISDVTVSEAEQGIELGYGTPEVSVQRAHLHHNDVGLRVGDSYDRPILGHITVTDSVIAENASDVRNYSNELMAPVSGALDLRCSFVGKSEELPACNQQGAPDTLCSIAASDCECAPPVPVRCD